MIYYKRYLGDYAANTKQLSTLEHGVYALLLDHYYSTEKPLPLRRKDLYQICGASNFVARRATNRVLKLFFERTKNGYSNKRVERELKEAKDRINTARNNGLRGGYYKHKGVPNPTPDPTPVATNPLPPASSYSESDIRRVSSLSSSSRSIDQALTLQAQPPKPRPRKENYARSESFQERNIRVAEEELGEVERRALLFLQTMGEDVADASNGQKPAAHLPGKFNGPGN